MLTAEQREQFVAEGYLVIKGAFPREQSLNWVRDECKEAGYDVDDPTTWQKDYVRIDLQHREPLGSYAPAAWDAATALMGGRDRVKYEPSLHVFAVNFKQGADRPFEPPSAHSPGWHKDGWHFRHFLDSPEQGLLGIPLFTDVLPSGGATFIAADSVPVVARYLAAHPEGVLPNGFDIQALMSECSDFREVTGEAGDFYLLHPFMLHAVSQNVLQRPRAISNVLYELNAPMQLNRLDDDYSPIEAAVLHGLGVEHFKFKATEPRLRSTDGGPLSR